MIQSLDRISPMNIYHLGRTYTFFHSLMKKKVIIITMMMMIMMMVSSAPEEYISIKPSGRLGVPGRAVCQVCGKEFSQKSDAKRQCWNEA